MPPGKPLHLPENSGFDGISKLNRQYTGNLDKKFLHYLVKVGILLTIEFSFGPSIPSDEGHLGNPAGRLAQVRSRVFNSLPEQSYKTKVGVVGGHDEN